MFRQMISSVAVRTVAAAAFATTFVATPLSAETLSLAHFVAPGHVVTGSVVEPLAEGVSADTDGELTIDVYPGGELGAGPMEQYVRALQGVADITWGLQGYTSSQFPKTMIVEMPGAIPDGMTGYEMLWNAYDAHLTDEFPGTKPLALWASEPNIIIMKNHEVRTPEDLAGLKIRVSGSIASSVVEALGATPVQMPAGEIYNALQTGLIDGLITGASAVADFKLDEVANSYTVGAPLGHISFYLVMNQERYDGLSDEFKAAVDNHSGLKLSQSGEESWNERADETLESIRASDDNTVIDLTPEEAEAFAELTLPVTDELVAEMGAEDVLATMRGEGD
ncbi:TRAP transporter substrate-binding protein [Chelativorans sp. YIM 93263]|uniref:TRAP transporter substrate-binding protein n=1 Tax=Chelativorans sp. YIM 93263 TaxID=2906648 RepID=UPI002379C3FD|nr:TRAP transporter substrate-binding protein [Chelativorans sp. YIM 93263]